MSTPLPQALGAQRFGVTPDVWVRTADILAVMVALALPWSTSLVAIFFVLFALSLLPVLDTARLWQVVKTPAASLPIALFALALIGTLWASDTAWAARLKGISPAAKLLAIPLLIYHFQRSSRGLWVAAAFFVSCSALMAWSYASFLDPRLILVPDKNPGVPVKNYIAQSQEFALCAFAAAGAAVFVWKQQRGLALALAGLGALLIANMLFVASSRTVLVCIPVLLMLFTFHFFNWRGIGFGLAALAVIGAVFWTGSPYLRDRMSRVVSDYREYRDNNTLTSTSQRLEYWRKSLKFIEAAPLFGNGTGATRTLFERDAVGQTGVSAEIIGNPHNQTLNVAVQWGLLGVIALYVMWLSHLWLFGKAATLAGWIGLVAVVENIVSSLFNSHVFDFHEGWIYVLAVGVMGGIVMQRDESAAERSR